MLSRSGAPAALAVAAALCIMFSGCGGVEKVTGKISSDPEKDARNVAPDDPLARPMQVGWTSARASHCGFIFDPNQLRANYLAAEAQSGRTPDEMAKIARAYDYTRDSVAKSIRDNLAYCTPERVAAIRKDLNRYLAGDYTPAARMGR
jgi:hypothetical protein